MGQSSRCLDQAYKESVSSGSCQRGDQPVVDQGRLSAPQLDFDNHIRSIGIEEIVHARIVRVGLRSHLGGGIAISNNPYQKEGSSPGHPKSPLDLWRHCHTPY